MNINPTSAAPEYRGAAVGHSIDLDRIQRLPKRELNPEDPRAAVVWTQHLKRNRTEPCDCVERWGRCITELKPIQGWTLEEAMDHHGILGIIGVGHGKTGLDILLPMAIPNCKVAVLLIPASLKRQFWERDYPQWSAHFRVPNLAGWHGGMYTDGRPTLTVMTYNELSLAKNSDMLTRLRPDLIIADEAHNLKDKKSARTKRFLRAAKRIRTVLSAKGQPVERVDTEAPKVRFVALSGTMTSKSIKDYAHLSQLALGEGSPLPNHEPTLDSWSAALDAGDTVAPMGMLSVFGGPGESARSGFARRLVATPGVIATTTASVSCSLELSVVPVVVPPLIPKIIAEVRETACRPDGEEADCALTLGTWYRQLSAGFYSRMIFPKGEPEAVILKWLATRACYHREVREKLKRSKEFLDSPMLLARAAIRWHDGYSHDGKKYPPHCRTGPMPVWESMFWPEWRDIRHEVDESNEVVWVDDFLVRAAADWAKKNVGIVWVEHNEFGRRIAQLSGLPFYDGKGKNPELDEKGGRSIIASIKANSDGKNLQHLWNRNLLTNMISDAKTFEQLMGRTHRDGQQADVVTVEMFIHTAEMRAAWDSACQKAEYIQATNRTPQKLCFATIDLTGAVADTIRRS